MKYERTSSSPRMAVEESHEDVKRRGRRVVATTALQPGDAIYAAPPDISVLYSPFASHICARCLVAEVGPEEKKKCKAAHLHHPPRQRAKGKRQTNQAQGAPNAPGLAGAAVGAGLDGCFSGASASPSLTSTAELASSAISNAVATPHEPYVCPNCDQFVLCASCVRQLVLEVAMMAAEAEDQPSSTKVAGITAGLLEGRATPSLQQHPVLRAHVISCAWYTSLPESIRAPGNDTDFLRFCLDYGARVQLGDTTMVAALGKLDTNAAVQSKEAHHLCEVFARDRVVATFGPRKPAGAAVANPLAAAGVTPPTLPGYDRLMFPPPYPVAWTDLRDVLLRTRCNSLGFPFTPAETTGWSLQETVCMLNHSCVPNAAVVMLYDADDERRIQQQQQQGSTQSNTSGEAAAAEEEERGHRRLLYHRRGQRSSVSPTRERGSSSSGRSNTYTSKGKNLNSYRAIAVSSPSPFSTAFTESLEGWIGIQAIRPIAAGEEITVSYIDLEVYGDDVQTRSRHLLEQYRFLCTCELCTRQRGRKL
jgi:hypothetical protein